MWILNQNKDVLTNGTITIYYETCYRGFRRFNIYIKNDMTNKEIAIGVYNSVEEAKEAFNMLVKKVNLYENVLEIG